MGGKTNCAARIKEGLQLRSLTQSELCKLTGIPKSAMSQYCKGTIVPRQDRTYLIAKALNVSEAWLMGFDVPIDRDIEQIAATPSPILPPLLEQLIAIASNLNMEGQEKLVEYAQLLDSSGQYKKYDKYSLAEKEA